MKTLLRKHGFSGRHQLEPGILVAVAFAVFGLVLAVALWYALSDDSPLRPETTPPAATVLER